MEVIRAESVPDLGAPHRGISSLWVRGPGQDDTLDVAIVGFEPGSATPPHVHHGGQTLVILSGQGFVEVDGVRTEVSSGDIVVSPPGESHVHGAADDAAMVHVSVTTGRNELLGDIGPAFEAQTRR
ncbi:cupin domain-containing protein [Frankia sp. QA3]|uniref:cupin domain-containing protein n=1 Tax=Frankia sp. QA3 TaxID=710111 RepID=UPI000269C48F|nr:cupin domain-containing protein [Frankia sp. QA3]EIV94336.1 cupin domain-containing protein [Frankia sp. QA3]